MEKLELAMQALEEIAKERNTYHEPSDEWRLANIALNALNKIRGDRDT